LRAALAAVHRDELPPAFKMLARVSRIFEQLVQAWNVLATMTPSEYTAMRPYLGQSSGFQSHQYRQIEFMLGNKNEQMLKPHAHRPEILEQVRGTLEAPSFYDEVIRLLARRGFEIDSKRLERDWTQPTTHDPSVEAIVCSRVADFDADRSVHRHCERPRIKSRGSNPAATRLRRCAPRNDVALPRANHQRYVHN